MIIECYLCGEVFKDKEMVELTIIAPYHQISSNRSFSIGKPVDSYIDTLRHNKCPEGLDDEDYQV